MTIGVKRSNSRVYGVAERLLARQVDPAVVAAKKVLITGEEQALRSMNGRWCFLDSLRLVSRVVAKIIVALPPGMERLRRDVEAIRASAWARDSIEIQVCDGEICANEVDAILSVGSRARPELPWTVINSNGWVARVSSGSHHLPTDCEASNPLAALMAASLGAVEVFKRVFEVSEAVAPFFDKFEFSLFELSISPSSIGPQLPDVISLPDTLLVGGGAIGNAIALLLSQLRVRGRLHIVDKQTFADENIGTCVLLDRNDWLGTAKAERLTTWLSQHSGIKVSGEKSLIADAISGDYLSNMQVDLVLNGLDDPDARCDSQRLWPRITVDGGINEVGASVIQHRIGRDFACLICWFQESLTDERMAQSRWTGLSVDSLSDIDRLLTDEDIARASKEKRDWLRECQRREKRLCSIITEAQLESRLGVKVAAGFRPSVPFVASAAACLVMSEAVKALLFPSAAHHSLFQIGSLFLGPDASIGMYRPPNSSCICVAHRNLIRQLSEKRHCQS